MYENPQQRAENFAACREIGLTIQCPKLRKNFQAMLKDTDELMVVFTQDELRDEEVNFNVAEKTIWTLGELGQTILKKKNGNPRSTLEVKEMLVALGYLVCDEDGKNCEPGKKMNPEKHLVDGRCPPIHPRFTSAFYKDLQDELSKLNENRSKREKAKVRQENEANGIFEETEEKK